MHGRRAKAMMIRTRYFFGTLVMVVGLVLAPVSTYALDDVLGWEGTTWAMTESEVAKAMEAHSFDLIAARTPLGGPLARTIRFRTTAEIGGHTYDVAFQFLDRTRRLDGVLIGALDTSREHSLNLYDSLLRTLTARHGPPSEAESRANLTKSNRWTFKTTIIVLHFDAEAGVRGHPLTQVSLVYEPNTGPDERDAKAKGRILALLRLLSEGWRP
jgi:hypothetical protein